LPTSADGAEIVAGFLDVLKAAGKTAYEAQTGGLQVSVKTNLGPEFKVWDGAPGKGRGGLAQTLGIRGAIILRDHAGKLIAVHGEPPPTNLLLTGIYAAGVAYLGYLLWRGATRKRGR